MKQLTVNEAAAFLLARDRFVILTHRRPDGDTIGCAAALCGGLRALGKQAAILENPQFTPKFRPYLEGLTCPAVQDGDCIVAVDIATERIFAYNAAELPSRVELVIDHHGRNSAYAANGLVEPQTAACGEIVLRVLQAMGVPLTKRIAEALYVAISTDTGCFRYSNTTAETLRAAAVCKDAGADTFAINRVMFLTRRLARLKLDAYLTQTTEFYAGGIVAVSAIPSDLIASLGLTEDDIDDISGFGRDIEGVEIGVMIRQAPEGGKLSVRTSPAYNAAEYCAQLGGGGHAAAAGATVPGGIAEAKEAILCVLRASGVAV